MSKALFMLDRPTVNAKAVRDAALDSLLKDVLNYLRSHGDDADDAEDIRKQLSESVGWNDDGYAIASELDRRYYWGITAELVEVLDGYGYDLMHAKDEAVRQWVKDCDVKAAKQVGDVVTGKWGREIVTGTITDIYHDTAMYVVRRKADEKGSGVCVHFENIQEPAQ